MSVAAAGGGGPYGAPPRMLIMLVFLPASLFADVPCRRCMSYKLLIRVTFDMRIRHPVH